MSWGMPVLSALLVFSAAFPTVANVADYWDENLPVLPTARQEVGVAVLDGMVYVIGGILDNGSPTAIVERFNIEAGVWESIRSLPGRTGLHHVGAASAGGKVYSVGGLNGSFTGVQTLFAFDPAQGSWERLADLPTARGAVGVAAIDDRIYVAGGQSGGTTVNTFAVYLTQENRWEALPDMPTGRNHLAAASLNGTFYAVGGRSGGLRNQLEAYDPLDNAWTVLTPMPTARGGIAAAVLDETIFVFGGEGNSADPFGIFPHVEAYNPAQDSWERREDMANPRHGIGAAAMDDRIFIPGGSPIQGLGVTDVHDAFVPGCLLVGDYNCNGTVDAADYTVWRDTLGQTGENLPADGTGRRGAPDGVVNQLDYDFWVANFGNTASSSASAGNTAVPEPASALLVILASVAVFLRSRRTP